MKKEQEVNVQLNSSVSDKKLTRKEKKKLKKQNRKKRPWWKKLLIALTVIAAVVAIDIGLFHYISHVVMENLEAIANIDASPKISVDYDSEDITGLISEATFLSGVAYMDNNQDWMGEMTDKGYENVKRIANDTSAIYKLFKSHGQAQSAYMFSSVNTTIATKKVSLSGEDKILISVAFRGTDTSNVVDDLSDMFIKHDKDGFHEGFKWNAENFYKKTEKVEFTINGETVLLKDIIESMKSEDCDYVMLVTGHSLGAAVADVFVGNILYNDNISPHNVSAVTFGTPKTVSKSYQYPYNNIINIINDDDFVPTVGAESHLGSSLLYQPDNDFRHRVYGEKCLDDVGLERYNDLTGTVASGLIAHSFSDTYCAISEELIKNPENYFTFNQ